MFNKKYLFALISVLTLSFLLVACGGGDQSNGESEDTPEESEGTDEGTGEEAGTEFEKATWKFATEEQPGQVQYEYAAEFAKRIKEKTNGKITVQTYKYGDLGTSADQVKQLKDGVVQLAVMSPGFTGTMVKEGQLFALHFLFPDSVEKTQEILNTSKALNEDLRARYEEFNISPLAFWTEGAMAWTSNVGLQEPSDFDGLKMRVQESPLMIKSYEQYGANPQSMAWGELYTGLDRGTVEGQENPIFFIYEAKFHEVQDTMTISNHNNYVAMTTVNTEWYNGLPENEKKLVDETIEEMKPWVFDLQTQMNADNLEAIKNDEENPTEIIELTDEQRAAFRELATPMQDYYRENVSTVNGEILDKLKTEIEEATAE